MVLSSLIAPATQILDKFIEDKDQKNKLAHELATMADRHAQEALLAQLAINKEEAKGNWFQSSWRPLCGYVCVISLAINYMISPICSGFGVSIPQADMSVMMPLLLGMLGIAGMTQQGGLMQQAGELGVDPRSFGIFNNASAVSAFDPKGGISSEYAMQTALEFVPVPMILLKLVPIDRPVPINSVRVVRQPAPKQQPAPAK